MPQRSRARARPAADRVFDEGGTHEIGMDSPQGGRGSQRRRWWCALLVFAGLSWAWSFATPIFDGPDEYAHAIRAYAIFSGELVPSALPVRGVADLAVTPAPFDRAAFRYPRCLIARPEVTPNCLPKLVPLAGVHRASSSASRYPPLYYVAVGAPLKLLPGTALGLLLSRLLSGVLSAMFLASAVLSAYLSRHRACLLAGLAVAVTPQVVYTNGVVNPSAFEISAAVGLWMAGLVILTAPDTRDDRRLLARLALAGIALVSVKASGPVLLLLLVVVLIVLARAERLRPLAKNPTAIGWGLVLGLVGVASVAWTVLVHPNTLGSKPHFGPGVTTARIVRASIGLWDGWARQMVGNFGYNDLPGPQYSHYIWVALAGALVIAAVVVCGARLGTALAVLLTIVLVGPVIGSTLIARSIGFGYQGRYTLPIAVGLPLVAGLALGTKVSGSAIERRLLIVVTALAATAHFAAFAYVLHRFTVGQSGPLVFWTRPLWSPFAPAGVLLLALLVLLALALTFAAASRSTPGRLGVRSGSPPLLTGAKGVERR